MMPVSVLHGPLTTCTPSWVSISIAGCTLSRLGMTYLVSLGPPPPFFAFSAMLIIKVVLGEPYPLNRMRLSTVGLFPSPLASFAPTSLTTWRAATATT